jgi:hypothetical protein
MRDKTTQRKNPQDVQPQQRVPDGRSFTSQFERAKEEEGGRPLPDSLRQKMERSFGVDFAAVRIFENNRARRYGADATAEGDNLHFTPDAYRPDTPTGQELLGHELAHVVQQQQGRVPRGENPHQPNPQLEAEAETFGLRAAMGSRVFGFSQAGWVGGEGGETAVVQPGKKKEKKAQKKKAQKKKAQKKKAQKKKQNKKLPTAQNNTPSATQVSRPSMPSEAELRTNPTAQKIWNAQLRRDAGAKGTAALALANPGIRNLEHQDKRSITEWNLKNNRTARQRAAENRTVFDIISDPERKRADTPLQDTAHREYLRALVSDEQAPAILHKRVGGKEGDDPLRRHYYHTESENVLANKYATDQRKLEESGHVYNPAMTDEGRHAWHSNQAWLLGHLHAGHQFHQTIPHTAENLMRGSEGHEDEVGALARETIALRSAGMNITQNDSGGLSYTGDRSKVDWENLSHDAPEGVEEAKRTLNQLADTDIVVPNPDDATVRQSWQEYAERKPDEFEEATTWVNSQKKRMKRSKYNKNLQWPI